MKISEDELISIISDVTTLLGQALAQHVELKETVLTGSGVGIEVQKKRIETLKSKIAAEKTRLNKLRDAAKRKKELEKANLHRHLKQIVQKSACAIHDRMHAHYFCHGRVVERSTAPTKKWSVHTRLLALLGFGPRHLR